ncbi:hypothetical protein [Streptomyces caeruleatus]|uniref:Uncharacterized protein n=1 Tax=Streptomyces caeruleatus TaxID=661399 RepID=A0A124I9Q8_9ACTN|nr:hypothetical protein [Streptomyces caeruleatus]KUO03322.1 hypothetical protein AQJ67_16490 [Streptomyces caeruleatus]
MMDYTTLLELWQSFGAPANIYEVDSGLEPLDNIVELAQRAGMSEAGPSAWTEFGPLLEIEQQPYVCTVFQPSRALRLVDTERWQTDDGSAHMEVTDSEAIFAAVQEAGFLGLFGEDQFAPLRVTRLNVATAELDQPPGDQRVIDVGVVLTRQLDGLGFLGQGGNIVMYLDQQLSPTGFERTARRISGVREAVSGWRGLDEVLGELVVPRLTPCSRTPPTTRKRIRYSVPQIAAEASLVVLPFRRDPSRAAGRGKRITGCLASVVTSTGRGLHTYDQG